MAKTCPSCGYSPIGPFTENCPLCGDPVRGVRSCDGGRLDWPASLPPLLAGGWIVIAVALAYLFWGDWPWILLSVVLCATAWWPIAVRKRLLWRLLGGSLLVLFIPSIWLAAQPNILPGLDRRDMSPERFMGEIMQVLRGTSPETLRMRARMKTISGTVYASHAMLAIPLALLVPPLLNYRQRRKLGGRVYLSKPQAIGGLAAWLLVLPLLAWLAWPMMRNWADAPNNQLPIHWPGQAWPADRVPEAAHEPDID